VARFQFLLFAVLLTQVLSLPIPCKAGHPPPEQSARASLVSTLGVFEVLSLVNEHNLDIQMSRIQCAIVLEDERSARNDFDTTFDMSLATANSEFGGVTADSSVFGTEREDTQMKLDFGKPLFSGGTIGFGYLQADSKTNSSFASPETFRTSIDLSWSQPLFRGSGNVSALHELRRTRVAAKRTRLLAEQTIIDVRDLAIKELFECRARVEAISIHDKSVNVAGLLFDSARERKKAGLASKLDVLEAELRLREAEATLVAARGQLTQARNTLATRLCVPLDKNCIFALDLAYEARPFNEAIALQQACRKRLDIRIKENELAERLEVLRYATAQDRPALELASSISKSGEGDNRSDSRDLENTSYAVQVRYTTPLGRRDDAIERNKRQKELALARLALRETKAQAILEVRNVHQALRDAEATLRLAQLQANLAEQRWNYSSLAYKNNVRSLLHVVEAEEEMTEKRAEHLTAIVRAIGARLALLKTMGSTLDYQEVRRELGT